MRKHEEINSHQNRLVIFKCNSFGDQQSFPIFPAMFYAFTEEILILLYNPLVYGYNDGFIVLKARPRNDSFKYPYGPLEIR